MNLLLMSLLCSAILPLSLSKDPVCLPTWSVIHGVSSSNGELVTSVTQLQYCLIACERKESCLAIDFDQQNPNKSNCWLHNSADQLFGDNFRNQTLYPYKAQYRIHRNCSDLPGNLVEWKQWLNTSSGNGMQVNYWTEYDCFTFCRYRIECVAVAFDERTEPPCWMHTDPSDLSPVDVYAKDVVVHYRLNKTDGASERVMQAGRCIGQWFPNTTWCQSEAIIQIQSASFKSNPLCPLRNADDANVPDADWLPTVVMQYLDSTYYKEIQACNGSSQCYLRSKCPLSGTYDEPCSNPVIEANFVSILYTCFTNGSTTTRTLRTTPVMSTTQATDTRQTAVATRQTAVATRQTAVATQAPSTTENAVSSNVGIETRNKNRDVIIGVVVGIGAPLILIAIIVIVFVVIKQRRSKQEKLASTDNRYVVYDDYDKSTVKYENSTVQRGVYPDNEINEISMNVDTM